MNHPATLDHSQVSTKITEDPNPNNPLLEVTASLTQSKVQLPTQSSVGGHALELMSMNSLTRTERPDHVPHEEGSAIDNGSSLELSFGFSVTTGRILDCFASVGISL